MVFDLQGVGENFQDHPSVFGLTWTVARGSDSVFRVLRPQAIKDYATEHKGEFLFYQYMKTLHFNFI